MTEIDPAWVAVAPVLIGAGVGLVARRVIAAADKRRPVQPRTGGRR